MNRILVCGAVSDAQMAKMRDEFVVNDFRGISLEDNAALEEVLPKADALINGGLAITPALLDRAPSLKVIATISVGYDAYPVDELSARGILLCNTPDVLTETTADTGFSLIMATGRRVAELDRWVRQGEWKGGVGPAQFGKDVHGKTLGMIGLGRIGAAVARRGALGFGMSILYSNSSSKPDLEQELGARRCEMSELLAEADYVCVTVPLVEETVHLIGADEFALMKHDAVFINIARGKVVDEQALVAALQKGRPGAAGLDVYEVEPLPGGSPLFGMDNVVLLPHVGSATHETRDAMAQRAVDNTCMALRGETPISPVNIDSWQR